MDTESHTWQIAINWIIMRNTYFLCFIQGLLTHNLICEKNCCQYMKDIVLSHSVLYEVTEKHKIILNQISICRVPAVGKTINSEV